MTRQIRLSLIGIAVLLAGLGSASVIYLAADSGPESEAGYEVRGTFIYPAMNERSKKYRHDLEMYGGKTAVLADDFNRWFDGLWRGQTLAFTVAVLSALAASGFLVAARHGRADRHADVEQGEEET